MATQQHAHTLTHSHTRYAIHADVLILFPGTSKRWDTQGDKGRWGGRKQRKILDLKLIEMILQRRALAMGSACVGRFASIHHAAILPRHASSCLLPPRCVSSRLVKTQEIISSFHKLLCRKSLQSNGRTHTHTLGKSSASVGPTSLSLSASAPPSLSACLPCVLELNSACGFVDKLFPWRHRLNFIVASCAVP